MSTDARENVRRHYDGRAGRYDRMIRIPERLLFGDGRAWVCGQATGDVLELAVGTGRNLGLYPAGVTLTGIELSPRMLAIARERARALAVDVDLREGDAEHLDLPDGRFDTVVATLALCTIPAPERALAEARRVLRPSGRLLLLEHVRSPNLVVRAIQRLLDPVFVRFEADHLLRDPLDYLDSAGFEVERLERSSLGIVERLAARRDSDWTSGLPVYG